MHHDCYHQTTAQPRSRPVGDAIKICKLETAAGTALIRTRITLLQRFCFCFFVSFLVSQELKMRSLLQKYGPLWTLHSPQDTAGLVPSKYLICGHQQSASQPRSSQLIATHQIYTPCKTSLHDFWSSWLMHSSEIPILSRKRKKLDSDVLNVSL